MLFEHHSMWGLYACLGLSSGFVLSLYLLPKRIRLLSRDHPTHIYYRMITSSLITLLFLILGWYYGLALPHTTYLASIGLRLDNLIECSVVAIVLMSIFYAGPLCVNFIYFFTEVRYEIHYNGICTRREKPLSLHHLWQRIAARNLPNCEYILLRNLFVGPITEELVFRSLIVLCLYRSLTSAQSVDVSYLCVVAPMWFAVAHLHHLVDKLASGVPLVTALLTLLLQLTYTSIFGYIATYLFLRTGNITCAMISHIMCNFMGLPDISFAKNDMNEMRFLYRFRFVLLGLHVAGLVMFYLCMDVMTARLVRYSPFV